MGDDRRSLPTLPPIGMASVDQKHGAMFESDLRTTPPSTDTQPIRLPSYPPPSYSQARQDPAAIGGNELAPIKIMQADHGRDSSTTLPSLSSLDVASPPTSLAQQPPEPAHSSPAPQVTHWPSLNPLTAYYNPSHAQNADSPMRMDADTISNSSVSGASSDRFLDGRASSVNLDDPDVRMAAEALGDLRADFVSSPGSRHTPQPGSPRSLSQRNQPEPLLSLLTTYHPLLATTIEGTKSAYTSSKDFSPRIQWTAERLEDFAGPIANAVGQVSRVTGVDSRVRWLLSGGKKQAARKSDVESADEGSNKRRKVGNTMIKGEEETMDLPDGMQTPRPIFDPARPHERRLSVASTIESLPAYDDATSPPYAEKPSSQERPSGSVANRFMMSNSSLAVSMSPQSLSKLKYCLGCLRWANEHIDQIVTSLKTTIESYEKTPRHDEESGEQQTPSSNQEQMNQSQLAAKIEAFKKDVKETLAKAVKTVSDYTGSTLPENAQVLVRYHLTSLPQRWKQSMAEENQMSNQPAPQDEESQTAQDKATRESARRVLVLAREGLDVMSQVSGVLNGTIVNAEEWCERLGRQKREEQEGMQTSPPAHPAAIEEKTN